MRTLRVLLVAIVATATVAGCGKNPAAPTEGETVIKRTSGLPKGSTAAAKPTSTKPATGTATKAPTTSTKAPGVSTKPGPSPTPKPTSGTPTPAPAAGDGALRVAIRLWGTQPVGSLKLAIFDQVDPTQATEVPLQLTGAEAVWEQEDIPAGRYTIRVNAYSPDAKAMGFGATEAIVKGGELTDLTIDLGVDKPIPTPTPVPDGGESGATGEPEATPTPAATATPAPTGPGSGGTLGLRVEIL
jgi:hypothetical protein